MTDNAAAAAAMAPVDPRRRRLMLAASFGACLAAWPSARLRAQDLRLRASRHMMGTVVDIAVAGGDADLLRSAQAAAFERMAALVAMMSHYEPTSRVAAINLAAGLQPVAIEPELMQVLAMAQRMSRRSGGAFDVTVGSVGRWHFDPRDPVMPPAGYIAAHLADVDWRQLQLDERAGTAYLARRGMRIDPGGIAKLAILDAGLQTLKRHGVTQALINGGGDVVATSGGAQRPWRVGIRDPREPSRLLAAIDVREGFVASSGDYERCFVRGGRRYHHVLDPKTGYPAQGPHGVTLVGTELAAVNGLGAAAMVLPAREAHGLIGQTRGVQALIAGRDNGLWITAGLRERLQPA
ncbi:FAD:protein FMN transferase [Ramlibacter sp.]|uniref:FAD:protein FMN transferase n=1 Tax=Ramlibacter sp. TaxID=1917967 RepID=UPI002BD0985B|nr:FAD:protein FMN transferase [Ramlibacter sp.]HWI80457.1 FAD:protein FMN transferase [Ramlibacter sp.]